MVTRSHTRTYPSHSLNVLVGAALGAALGGVFLLIGVARAAFFLMSGGRLQPIAWTDLRPIAFYIGGFAVAGGFLGLLCPILRGRVAIAGALAVSGAIVMNAIAISDKGVAGMDALDWVVMTVVGAVFGLGGGYGLLRTR